MSAPAVELDQVTKVFSRDGKVGGQYVAVRDVSLEVREGEFFCLLGPSGCGKSTLLHIVASFEHPSGGRVQVFGREVREPSLDRGVIFQSDRALFDWLTVEENVAFGLEMRRVDRQRRRELVDRNLELVGLARHRDKFPRELSGGMKQRVQIARVLANDPRILLMDEPFGALDAQTRRRMQREVTRIWSATGKTVLFVTHDISEAIWLADRIGVMTHGPAAGIKRVVEVNLPRPRASMTPEFTELFNLLNDEIEHEIEATADE